MTDLSKLPNVELALQAALWGLFELESAEDRKKVGRDLKGTVTDWYVRIVKVPSGSADQIQGDVVVDIESFAPTYLEADSRAGDIDAFLLGYPHVVEVGPSRVVLDKIIQNVGPGEIPWEDPKVSRVLATYVVTLRR